MDASRGKSLLIEGCMARKFNRDLSIILKKKNIFDMNTIYNQ